LAGAIFVTAVTSIVMGLAMNILDVNIPDTGETFLFMLFTGYMFYLLQNAILNWLGFAGAPLFILLFFFSSPILSFPVEFMSDVTRDWLYSWIPFKYSVEGFRSIFFFGGYNIGTL
jgi:uncharacterized phage infection (PIP) family protein YhgE